MSRNILFSFLIAVIGSSLCHTMEKDIKAPDSPKGPQATSLSCGPARISYNPDELPLAERVELITQSHLTRAFRFKTKDGSKAYRVFYYELAFKECNPTKEAFDETKMLKQHQNEGGFCE